MGRLAGILELPEAAGLMVLAGAVFASTRDPLLLTLAAIVGVISPSGSEVGPFQAVEQAALPETAPGAHRTQLIAYWFHVRFGADPGLLGAIFFGTSLLAGVSALAAARIAARIGLLETMVFTHIPSNLLLMLVPP